MTRWVHSAATLASKLALTCALAIPAGAGTAPDAADEARIVHALNRLGYGPRPGDIDKVRAVGLDKWIDQQLHPERVADPEVQSHLASLTTIRLSSSDLMRGYEIPPTARREIQRERAELGENASEEGLQRARRELLEKYRGEMQGRPQQVIDELQEAKLLRAIYSERQLDEVLVDFWMNHFNVYAQKGQDRFLIGEYERDVIRPHAWGKFEDLLRATAESPAMLFYLDNWLSADPDAKPGPAFSRPYRRRSFGRLPDDETMRSPHPSGSPGHRAGKRGLNENYAREIMELHTLGVDGGYTQKDVTELARVLTGWTIRGLAQQRPDFYFDARVHDSGEKVVLGHVIKGNGKAEGDRMIHVLATHPSTARFISLALCRRFVSDAPPSALVDRAAETFRTTGGDIRAVVKTIATSPEFFAPEARSAKVKTPLEFVVSAVRASGARVDDASPLARRIAAMGMPLYLQQPPTGYKDTSDAWISTSGLVARLNFALDLAANKLRGVTLDATALVPEAADADVLLAGMAARLLAEDLSESTRQTLAREAGSGLDPVRMAGLILGSPEFQRR
jgi:uncharacterized protein (DUF1800 family)